MKVIIIAAIGNQNQLGLDGDLPWRVPGDMRQFKKLTSGHAIFMGRKTFCGEGIQKPLPNRRNIILSSSLEPGRGIEVVRSFVDGLELAQSHSEEKLFICGGAGLYTSAFDVADEMLLSRIDYDGKADTFFPKFDASRWTEISIEDHPTEGVHPGWRYIHYVRKKD